MIGCSPSHCGTHCAPLSETDSCREEGRPSVAAVAGMTHELFAVPSSSTAGTGGRPEKRQRRSVPSCRCRPCSVIVVPPDAAGPARGCRLKTTGSAYWTKRSDVPTSWHGVFAGNVM